MAESGTSVSRENSNQSIDPNEVEILIDSSRMSRNWEDVLHWLKRYAHIFDIGAATSTFQHGNLDSVRAYYWVAMAETVFETKYDSNSAIECAKRAVDIYARCIEANVIVCRVLLHSFRAIIKNGPANLEDDPPSNVDKEPVSSYNDAMHVSFFFT